MSLFLGKINWLLKGTLSSGEYCDIMLHENEIVFGVRVDDLWFLDPSNDHRLSRKIRLGRCRSAPISKSPRSGAFPRNVAMLSQSRNTTACHRYHVAMIYFLL